MCMMTDTKKTHKHRLGVPEGPCHSRLGSPQADILGAHLQAAHEPDAPVRVRRAHIAQARRARQAQRAARPGPMRRAVQQRGLQMPEAAPARAPQAQLQAQRQRLHQLRRVCKCQGC